MLKDLRETIADSVAGIH